MNDDNVWLVLPGTTELVSPYELKSKPIKAAQAFSVDVVTAMVAQDLDGFLRGRNDVLVLSKVSMGEQPLVSRIHFYEEEVPTGKPIRNLLAGNVYTTDDYSGRDTLWIELNLLEIDTDTGERKAAVAAFGEMVTTVGAIFPAMLPYTFAARTGSTLIETLVSALEKNQNVVRFPFALYPGAPRPGMAVLQEGTYVVFSQPVDPILYRLQANGQVVRNNKPSTVSYMVMNVSAQTQVSAQYVLSQKVATLLTQIDKGNERTPRDTLNFLNSTLQAYSLYKKLERYTELKGLANPTAEETALMAEIKKIDALKPFIP
ncbi:hypothetical protein [Pseudomonas sp. UFMG81]|uniref:hypothetical protein n=1 Tax=Pseudomonas sp. UFMG81 TaxID=2745936 RepID=UPI00188EC598|nr:hypothetical protein [Pseudomonas sp. UFMG81]